MRRIPSYEAAGLAVLSTPDALARTGADRPDLPVLNILVIGFVTSVAAGLFVATLNVKPRH